MPYVSVDRESPMPANLEDAIKELRYWRREVFKTRERLANKVEKSEVDQRALRGTIKALNAEIKELKKVLSERKADA